MQFRLSRYVRDIVMAMLVLWHWQSAGHQCQAGMCLNVSVSLTLSSCLSSWTVSSTGDTRASSMVSTASCRWSSSWLPPVDGHGHPRDWLYPGEWEHRHYALFSTKSTQPSQTTGSISSKENRGWKIISRPDYIIWWLVKVEANAGNVLILSGPMQHCIRCQVLRSWGNNSLI